MNVGFEAFKYFTIAIPLKHLFLLEGDLLPSITRKNLWNATTFLIGLFLITSIIGMFGTVILDDMEKEKRDG